MATVQEPEVLLAQRLASNDKPVRTKAMKKLKKYITVRSQRATGGFTGDELLKLWKGLFYCLWMQDKPLPQEELSQRISGLLHSFQDVDGQLLYVESFLQTFKREWTGIDRLRMDKFYQLVRFMFRQTFEMLRRKNWESSLVGRVLDLLTVQILQSGCGAPIGLQFHILDLYLTELATVGSAELTADQNLVFIEPFCKTAARTKDRVLFRAICNSLFSTIIDQAPFAIEDLMREMKAAEDLDSDSGQASEGEDEEDKEDKRTSERKTKGAARPMNGIKPKAEEEEDEEDDAEEPCDEDVGPVLQFDYGALADRLLVFASRSSTPSQNRQRLYRIIKVLRDLSEGIFPQDECPEEVSTDEDDDMFCSRKRMKKRRGHTEEEEEEAPPSKKSKGKKKEASAPKEQNDKSAEDSGEPAEVPAENENKNKKKRRKKKKKKTSCEDEREQEQAAEGEAGPESSQGAVSSIKVTAAPSETPLVSEVNKPPSVTVTEENSQSAASTGGAIDQSEAGELGSAPENQTPVSTETSSDATVSERKKKKNKKKGLKSQKEAETTATTCDADVTEAAGVEAELKVNGVTTEEEDGPEKPINSATPGEKKSVKVEADGEGTSTDAGVTSVSEDVSADSTAAPPKKKTKKKTMTKDQPEEATCDAAAAAEETAETPPQTVEDAEKPQSEIAMTTSAKKKKKKKLAAAEVEATVDQALGGDDGELRTEEAEALPKRRKKRKIPVTFEFEADEVEAAATNGLAEETREATDPAEPPAVKRSAKKSLKKQKTSSGSASDFVSFQTNAAVPTPLFCRAKGNSGTPPPGRKKTQTPKSESKKVTFGLKNNKTAEFRKTDRSLLVSPDGSSRVPFDPTQKPKFGVLKSPATPLSTRLKKSNSAKKTASVSSNDAGRRRPSAADFF